LITKNSNFATRRCLYEAPIGYVSQPKEDKRKQLFVSAEVQRGSLGIATVFLPCEVLREYFYHFRRHDGEQLSCRDLTRQSAPGIAHAKCHSASL
jgi:hypothetical protein